MISRLLPFAAAAAAMAMSASAASVPFNATAAIARGFCGSHPSAEQAIAYERQTAALRNSAVDVEFKAAAALPIYFTIITASDGTGNIPDFQIGKQVNVINQNFAPVGLSWQVAGVRRIADNVLFNQAGDNQVGYNMKNRFHFGGPRDLQVYTVGGRGLGGSLVGYSSFPMDYNRAPGQDGIVMNYGAFVDGYLRDTNLGRLLVHEMGHWDAMGPETKSRTPPRRLLLLEDAPSDETHAQGTAWTTSPTTWNIPSMAVVTTSPRDKLPGSSSLYATIAESE